MLKLQGNSRESLQTYERAFQLDETSVPALTGKINQLTSMHITVHICTGIIYWQVMEGKLDEAEQQIEFLTEIQSSIGKNTVSYMTLQNLQYLSSFHLLGPALCQCITGTEEEEDNKGNY